MSEQLAALQIEEATIADIHAAYRTGDLTCRGLVAHYRKRIAAYDRQGPTINSIVAENPAAEAEAAALDEYFQTTGKFKGPLHGIPVVVKDQVTTAGIQTTYGSIAFDGYVPEKDAEVIRRLRAAGAVILAKTTMPDWATSWFAYSSKSGTTKNPYALDRDPGGSSSGTGAAVAANFGAVGIGEDTGGSIRLPASFDNLVGLKVTPGLISRTGLSPLVTFQDSAGPMTRTVEDAAKLLDVLVGFDPQDPYTAAAELAATTSYSDRLDKDALQGATVAVLRNAFASGDDPEAAPVNQAMEAALDAMRKAGAKLVDIEIPELMFYIEKTSLYIAHSRHDIDRFLETLPAGRPRKIKDIVEAKQYHPNLDLLEALVEGPEDPMSTPDYHERYAAREVFQRLIINAMAKVGAKALVFPTTQLLPPTRDVLDQKKWTVLTFPTNTLIAAQSWMPAVSVPAGFSDQGVPVGMEIVGLPYHEADLLSLAYAFEQVTQHRRAPASAPALPA